MKSASSRRTWCGSEARLGIPTAATQLPATLTVTRVHADRSDTTKAETLIVRDLKTYLPVPPALGICYHPRGQVAEALFESLGARDPYSAERASAEFVVWR